MSNLTQRVLSAFVALGLLALGLSFSTTGVFFLCLLATIISLFEFSGLWPKLESELNSSLSFLYRTYFIIIGTLFFLMAAKYPHWVFFTLPVFCALISGPTLWFLAKKENLSNLLKFLGMSIVGIVYCGLMPSISYQIALANDGLVLFVLHLSLVFSGDISAYFAGRFFGANKLHEVLSPKKTLEGAAGGLLGSVLAGLVWVFLFKPDVGLPYLLVLFLMTGIFAQLGDLFKSFFKRYANVKDSGGIMPGHGGILDRIDGVIFSSAVFYMFVLIFFKP